ncbi:MAG TPA: YncE family protein [Gammaproteobacteria bacterium]|nr:YncE family protein [Gammaproteobacteria bacterium]
MLRSIATVFALAAALSAAGESLNHPTGTQGVLLVDKLGGYVRFLDAGTLRERSRLELPKNPHDFALSADHRLAYVPIYGPGIYGRNPEPGHELYVLDLAEQKVASVIDLAPYRSPHGVQIDANGMLYLTAELDRKILVVDPKAGRIVDTIAHEGSGHWVAVLPDGSKAYVANKNDKPFLSVLDLKARKQIGTVPMPRGTQGVTASPDGKRIIAMDLARPELAVIDTATDTVLERVALAGTTDPAYKAYYSPDGKWLLTMAGSSISIFDAANLLAPQRTLKVGASPMGIGFSADGKTALVANHGDGTVSAVDIASATVTKTFKAGTGIETLTYY